LTASIKMNSSKRKNSLLVKLLTPTFWEETFSEKRKGEVFLKKDFWELVAEDYDALEETPFYKSMQEDILLEMEKRGALSPHFVFFDVACGTGNYTVKVAPKVKKVFALDISPSMLKILKEKLEKLKITNVEVIEADWRKYFPERTFDTVFVSMTPILRDLKEVKRLFECAERFLILISWAGLRQNPLLEEIKNRFFKKVKESKNPGILPIFNYFYTLGKPGDVKFYEGFFERRAPLERLWKRFKFRLESEGYKIGPKKEKEILKFLEEKAQEGMIESKTKVRIGALFIKK